MIISLGKYYNNDSLQAPLWYHVGTYAKKPVQPAVDYIKSNYKRGDIIIHVNPSSLISFCHYWYGFSDKERWENNLQYLLFFPDYYINEDLYWYRHIYNTKEKTNTNYIINSEHELRSQVKKRFWLVISNWERSREFSAYCVHAIKWSNVRFDLLNSSDIDNLLINLYELNDNSF